MQLWLCVLVLKKIQQKWDTIHDLETWACGSRHRPLETKWSQDSEHYPLLSLKTETKDTGEFPGSWFHKLYIDRRKTEKTVCSFVFPLINYLLLLLLSGFNCVWTSTNRMLKITRFSNFIRIKFALAFHLLCVPSSHTPLDQFSSFLATLSQDHLNGGREADGTGLTTHLSKEEGWFPWHPKEADQCSGNCWCLSHGSLAAQLCLTLATPWTVACQVPLSMRFSRPTILEWVAISFSSVSLELSKKRASWYVNRKSCFQWQTQPQTGKRWHNLILISQVMYHFPYVQFSRSVVSDSLRPHESQHIFSDYNLVLESKRAGFTNQPS